MNLFKRKAAALEADVAHKFSGTRVTPYSHIPAHIVIESEFFGREYAQEGKLVGKVLAIFRDTEGDQWCAFALADTLGVFCIHLGSNFFVEFTPND